MRGPLPTLLALLVTASGCALGGHGAGNPVDAAPGDALAELRAEDLRTEGLSTALPEGCLFPGTPGATSRCLAPTRAEQHYVAQALLYFDTLDVDADPANVPTYSENVARWEWPPWLLLTGYGREDMIEVSLGLKELDPSTVPLRDCRFFPVQPFARCTVEFLYDGGTCPIYEEFTFNDQGEMTFIEAWSDLPGLLPGDPADPWAEDPAFPRLSTRVPGLGNTTGSVDPAGPWMQQVAGSDPDVADFATRATDWWAYWFEALSEAPEDFFAQGCGWSPPPGSSPEDR